MAGGDYNSLSAAFRAIERDAKRMQKRATGAVKKAARLTARTVQALVPRAFNELADSIHIEDVAEGQSDVIADAPHAAAVEFGSRPHTPPLEPLIHWVELRGLEGLTASGSVRSVSGRRWAAAAKVGAGAVGSLQTSAAIATALRDALGRRGAAAWRQRAALGSLARSELGADPATVAIARAIQQKIKREGTKPHRYMAQAVPIAVEHLAREVRAALDKD